MERCHTNADEQRVTSKWSDVHVLPRQKQRCLFQEPKSTFPELETWMESNQAVEWCHLDERHIIRELVGTGTVWRKLSYIILENNIKAGARLLERPDMCQQHLWLWHLTGKRRWAVELWRHAMAVYFVGLRQMLWNFTQRRKYDLYRVSIYTKSKQIVLLANATYSNSTYQTSSATESKDTQFRFWCDQIKSLTII